jgi:hypothetical protein
MSDIDPDWSTTNTTSCSTGVLGIEIAFKLSIPKCAPSIGIITFPSAAIGWASKERVELVKNIVED